MQKQFQGGLFRAASLFIAKHGKEFQMQGCNSEVRSKNASRDAGATRGVRGAPLKRHR